jgi:hypothetical protein
LKSKSAWVSIYNCHARETERSAKTDMSNCDFTYNHYIETLKKTKETHTFYTFGDFPENPAKRFVLLRHDVDAQVQKALKMAKINYDLGVTATFFIRIHGPYNPFRQLAYNAILEIAKLDQEIGLHYEPVFYAKHGLPVEGTILFEIELLNHMFSMNIKSIAPHQPSLSNPKIDSIKQRFNDPYLPKFFSQIKYISDSNKRWREGCLCKWIEQCDRIQVAIHPHWWDGDSLEEYLEKYKVL